MKTKTVWHFPCCYRPMYRKNICIFNKELTLSFHYSEKTIEYSISSVKVTDFFVYGPSNLFFAIYQSKVHHLLMEALLGCIVTKHRLDKQ